MAELDMGYLENKTPRNATNLLTQLSHSLTHTHSLSLSLPLSL